MLVSSEDLKIRNSATPAANCFDQAGLCYALQNWALRGNVSSQSSQSGDLLLTKYRSWVDHGDDNAWASFAELARPHLVAGVWRAVRERGALHSEAVEDLVQEAYVKLSSENRSALRRLNASQAGILIAYLRIAAHNVARDHFRARSAAKRGGVEPASLEENSALAPDLEADIGRRLFLRRVEECLERSSAGPREQAMFWLYFRDGMTAKAIASVQAFGLTPKGVESALLRLVTRIRDCVAGEMKPLTSRISGGSPA